MKTIFLSILIFGIIIACVVVYSVDFGKREVENESASPETVEASSRPASPCETTGSTPNPPVTPAIPMPEPPSPPPVTPPTVIVQVPESPSVTVVYVPQLIERVYVKEVYHTQEVTADQEPVISEHPNRPDEVEYREPIVPVYQEERTAVQQNYQPNDGKCASFTGEARDRCILYIQHAGNRCDQYEKSSYYYGCLKHYGG